MQDTSHLTSQVTQVFSKLSGPSLCLAENRHFQDASTITRLKNISEDGMNHLSSPELTSKVFRKQCLVHIFREISRTVDMEKSWRCWRCFYFFSPVITKGAQGDQSSHIVDNHIMNLTLLYFTSASAGRHSQWDTIPAYCRQACVVQIKTLSYLLCTYTGTILQVYWKY